MESYKCIEIHISKEVDLGSGGDTILLVRDLSIPSIF